MRDHDDSDLDPALALLLDDCDSEGERDQLIHAWERDERYASRAERWFGRRRIGFLASWPSAFAYDRQLLRQRIGFRTE